MNSKHGKGKQTLANFINVSGHYPALGGFDMLFAAGGHSDEGWFLGYTEHHVRWQKNYGVMAVYLHLHGTVK
jgi:mannan endo-1,4-beta-mannosidase